MIPADVSDDSSGLCLDIVSEQPLNAETPVEALRDATTPSSLVYIRCNFEMPEVTAESWRLSVGGMVARPVEFSFERLISMPHHRVHATMECAGNARRFMHPVPPGTQWGQGAVSTVVFGGTPLRCVLEECGLDAAAVEIVFEGADGGSVDGTSMRFARSLPTDIALHPDTLIAWSMNDAPLERAHGYPARLFVPGWYGVASVKWLSRIEAVERPFAGHFQKERYIYLDHPLQRQGAPVTSMGIRSLITSHSDGSSVTSGASVKLAGIAWCGSGEVKRVEVSADNGSSWQEARLSPGPSRWAAGHWEHDWTPGEPGEHLLMARAEDDRGNRQPMTPLWNRLGYGNNAVHRLKLLAMEPTTGGFAG
jgi:DMSO/TMAO reductase YedYZ molybdopterin-dependent catalytic subunit